MKGYTWSLVLAVVIYSILWSMSEEGRIDDVRPALTGKPKFDGLVDGLVSPTIDEQINGKRNEPFRQTVLNVDGTPHIPDAELRVRKQRQDAHAAWLNEHHKSSGGGP